MSAESGFVDYGRSHGHWSFDQSQQSISTYSALTSGRRDISFSSDTVGTPINSFRASKEELTIVRPTQSQLAELDGIPDLKRVRLIGLRKAPPSDARPYSQITELVLRDVSNPEWLRFVAHLPNLRSLMITGAGIRAGLSSLADLNALRCLVIEGGASKEVQIDSLSWIDQIPSLEHLTLNRFRLPKGDLNGLTPLWNCRTLKSVWINPFCCELPQLACLHARLAARLTSRTLYDLHDGTLYAPKAFGSLETVDNLVGERLVFVPHVRGRRAYEGPRDKVALKAQELLSEFESLVECCFEADRHL